MDTPATGSEKRDPAYGWSGGVAEFLGTDVRAWLSSLDSHHLRCMNVPASESQKRAWQNCFKVLHPALTALTAALPDSQSWGIVFEYELPRERGRRPDVVILTGGSAFVLEFKDDLHPRPAYLDQARAYSRDLELYHAASHGLHFYTLLILTMAGAIDFVRSGVNVVSPDRLTNRICSLPLQRTQLGLDLAKWVSADYAPLPSLVSAARFIFNHEPLPAIRRAQSVGIPETLHLLFKIADRAQRHNERHLALVTGVPGAGKTLVGLQFVYSSHFGGSGSERKAVFLSGNGPLVKVLQHALRSSVFVQDVHGFLKRYGGMEERLPEEHVWVYDEAQRAWDGERVREKRGHGASEPEDFVGLAGRMGSWAMVIGLIGEGQEIHLGEEAGLVQWNDAVKHSGANWTVHCPGKVAGVFSGAAEVTTENALDLTVSLRSHLASDLQDWVSKVLGNEIRDAYRLAAQVRRLGFEMYITRDLTHAKEYLHRRYQGEETKRYGILASSKAKNLVPHTIRNDYAYTKSLREGPWYNDPPDSRFSCCQLRDVATEFSCQGLELDCPLIAWGDDMRWAGANWQTPIQPRSKAKDPHRLRLNSYRVLLSRGRDGFVVFVPPENDMDSTFEALMRAGLTQLVSSYSTERAA